MYMQYADIEYFHSAYTLDKVFSVSGYRSLGYSYKNSSIYIISDLDISKYLSFPFLVYLAPVSAAIECQ